MTKIRSWVDDITDDAPVVAIAEKIGMDQSQLNKQLKGRANINPEVVVKIARGYGANPLPGLVEIGLITLHEAGVEDDGIWTRTKVRKLLSDESTVTDADLVYESSRRLQARGVNIDIRTI